MGNKNYTKYSENSKNNKPSMNADELLNVLTSNKATDLGETIQEGLEAGINVDIENDKPENNENDKPENNENDKPENNENDKPENKNSANDEIVDATVSGCNKLYVRELPSRTSRDLCVIEYGHELTVNLTESTDTFYKVQLVKGETLISGYCMKEFISIK